MMNNLPRIPKRYRHAAWQIPGYILGTIAAYWMIAHYRDSFLTYILTLSVASLTTNWIVSRLGWWPHQGTRMDSMDNKGTG